MYMLQWKIKCSGNESVSEQLERTTSSVPHMTQRSMWVLLMVKTEMRAGLEQLWEARAYMRKAMVLNFSYMSVHCTRWRLFLIVVMFTFTCSDLRNEPLYDEYVLIIYSVQREVPSYKNVLVTFNRLWAQGAELYFRYQW
jgi:hypothetical protein